MTTRADDGHGTFRADPSAGRSIRVTGWRAALALGEGLADFDRLGFRTADPDTRITLEQVVRTFVAGYNSGLSVPAGHAPTLTAVPTPMRGFAVEGAAMAATLLDLTRVGPARRLPALLELHAPRHTYLAHVGVGWALAKLRWPGFPRLGHLDPLLRWLAHDGRGFATAFFASGRGLRRGHRRHRCSTTCPLRYQGLGRALWFRECGDPLALAAQVRLTPASHHGDTWSGIGLAATYAGGVPEATLVRLPELAGPHSPDLGQGSVFGAEAWRRSGQAPPHAQRAVRALTGLAVTSAADLAVEARGGCDQPGATAADYQRWRARVRTHLPRGTHHRERST